MPYNNRNQNASEIRAYLNPFFGTLHEGGDLSGASPGDPYEEGVSLIPDKDRSVLIRFQSTPRMPAGCDLWVYCLYKVTNIPALVSSPGVTPFDIETYYQVEPLGTTKQAIVGPTSTTIVPAGGYDLQTTIDQVTSGVLAWKIPAPSANSIIRFEIVRKGTTDSSLRILNIMSVGYVAVPTYETLSVIPTGIPGFTPPLPSVTNILNSKGQLLTHNGVQDTIQSTVYDGNILATDASSSTGISWVRPAHALDYKSRLVVTRSSTTEIDITCKEMILRKIVRGASTDKVTFGGSGILVENVNLTLDVGTVSLGGHTAAPANSTMWRIFVVAKENKSTAVIASPFTAASEVEDDLIVSNLLDSSYLYLREVGVAYVNSSGNYFDFSQYNDVVEFASPETVFTGTTLTTEASYALPDEIPHGCHRIHFYAHSAANTTDHVAMGLRSPSGAYKAYQHANPGIDGYGDSPTSVQGGVDKEHLWDFTATNVFAKSIATANAAINNQTLDVSGYTRIV